MNPPPSTVAGQEPDPAIPVAVALALALSVIAPVCTLPIDVDRTLPLLFAPALVFSWSLAAPRLSRAANALLLWALAAMVLSSSFAPNPAAAAAMCAAVGLAFSGAATSRRLLQSPRAIQLVLVGLLVGPVIGFAAVLVGWGADRMFFPVYWSARLFGAHMFSGALAGLALLLLPGLARPARILAGAGTFATWTALAWSGSRAPALGLAIALVVWFWRADRPVRRALLLAVPILGIGALLASRPLGTPYPQLGWWPAITRTVAAVEATSPYGITSDRTSYWEASWRDLQSSPLVGRGADAYQFIAPKQPGNQPHNTYLQWLLEYGALGSPAFLLLLLACLRPLRARASALAAAGGQGVTVWAASSLAGAAVYAFFEGVGYHMVALMPLAVIGGLAWTSSPAGTAPAASAKPSIAARIAALVAVALLLLHTWLGYAMLRGPAVAPDSLPAKTLRLFPSTTHGLTNWINRWMQEDPATGLAWIEWATTVSNKPANFHVQAAQHHLWAKDWTAAERELAASLDKVSTRERPDVQRLLDEIRAIIANNSGTPPPPPSASAP